MTKFCVVYGTWTTTANFSYFHLDLNSVVAYRASAPDSSPVVSRSLKGAGVNWGRLMKQGMMGRREGKRLSLLFAFPSPPAPASLIKIINENIRDDWGRVRC